MLPFLPCRSRSRSSIRSVGDLGGNARSILAAAGEGERAGARLVVTPELSLCGYPPEDLLLRPAFLDACARELAALAAEVRRSVVLVGFPEVDAGRCYNALAVLRDGRVAATYRKQQLPNYTVFDEERYFVAGRDPCIVDVDGLPVGLVICEDCWFPGPSRQAAAAGARVLVVANGSPYHTRQQALRREQVGARARETGLPVVYVNRVGGQDELVFDGASFVTDAAGGVAQQLPAWHETLALATFEDGVPKPVRGALDAQLEPHVYAALVMGVHDYVGKNRFPGVLLGLSGGVDSALTLAVAVDALGRDRVRAVMMPSPYNAPISLEDARAMAGILGVRYDEIPIEPMMRAFGASLAGEFDGLPADATEENIQARIRGTLLMALSNKFGSIVLTTGNKSEMAVGYATLYGDMAGGFSRAARHQQDAGLPPRALPQQPGPGDSGAHHHPRAVGGAARQPDRPGRAAALRRAGRGARGLRRAGPQPRRHRGHGLPARATCARSSG